MKYILDKGSKKFNCPSCQKRKFVKFIDSETNEYLPVKYGRCDAEINCGYFLNPYKDGYLKDEWKSKKGMDFKPERKEIRQKPIFFIPTEVLKATWSGWDKNVFIQNLLTNIPHPFHKKDVEKVISLYGLGTVNKGDRSRAVTFPFIDINKQIRAIQVKQFDKQNHTTGTDFLHTTLKRYNDANNLPLPEWLEAYQKNEKKVSCLFGEHLLNRYPSNPIALVEAPKTAIIGSIYFGFPEDETKLLWLAVYNLSSLNFEKCKVLEGRDIVLFPDLSKGGKAYQLWKSKAEELTQKIPNTKFHTSDLLENKASEIDKKKGLDIADYLIKMDWNKFRKPQEDKAEIIKHKRVINQLK